MVIKPEFQPCSYAIPYQASSTECSAGKTINHPPVDQSPLYRQLSCGTWCKTPDVCHGTYRRYPQIPTWRSHKNVNAPDWLSSYKHKYLIK